MFTGAAVRLTSSGLGCEDWPRCSEDRIVPEFGFHEWIEFGNRLLSGAVSIAVGALVWAARRLVATNPDHARRRLSRGPIAWGPVGWSWSIVAVVIGQILLGGATVLVDLHPIFVSVHFLASIVTVTQAAIVWHLAAKPLPVTPVGPRHDADSITSARHSARDARLTSVSWGVVALGAVVLILGTIVTGTGPNSGDARADRLPLDLEWTVRIHSVSAWLFVGSIVATSVLVARAGRAPRTIQRLLIASVAQGAVGYLQYATGVPPLLVEIHVIGSVAVWFLAVRHALSLTESPLTESRPDADSGANNGVSQRSPAVDELAPGTFSSTPTA